MATVTERDKEMAWELLRLSKTGNPVARIAALLAAERERESAGRREWTAALADAGDDLRAEVERLREQIADSNRIRNNNAAEMARLRQQSAGLVEALTDARDSVAQGGPGYCGDHTVYCPQIAAQQVERWSAALAQSGR